MTEVTAAIAITQLRRAPEIMAGRIALAEEIIDMARGMPFVRPPVVREGCEHVYYCIPFLVDGERRDWLADALSAEGVPMCAGYVDPLYTMEAFWDSSFGDYPVTQRVERQMMLFENCAYEPTETQRKQMREAFLKVGDELCK